MVDTVGDDVFTDVAGASVTFVERAEGVEILDPVERHRVLLETSIEGSLSELSTDVFPMPLDTATSFVTDSITLPVVAFYVRDTDGELITQGESFSQKDLPDGEYIFEFTSQTKAYLMVEGPLSIESNAERTTVDLSTEQPVRAGARLLHDAPAGTITTTDDPVDVMAAVSAFSHALKTTDPERSYPTLRGHPPLVERGDELSIPDAMIPSEQSIHVEVPPEYEYIFPASTLAYYLGASLRPGPQPRIATDDGFEHSLGGPHEFERTVEQTLKQVFVLDCATRTEGYYAIDLYERNELESVLDLDFPALYKASDIERLEAFLDVPYEDVEPYVPTWKTSAHVVPSARHVELLPFLVDELAVIKTPGDRGAKDTATQAAAMEDFYRSNRPRTGNQGGRFTAEYIQPPDTDAIEQVWAGEGTPIGASKAIVEAYLNRLDRAAVSGDITITVVVNAPEMSEESDLIEDVYGNRDKLPFDIRQYNQLTRAELRDVLGEEADFLHYIGHIDETGFECADGKLDSESIEETGVDAFLLNACSSYAVGMDLIRAGAIGGIVTLSDVLNNAAMTMGGNLAKLLNNGFPLAPALDIARDETYAGGQYTIVGDGGMNIAQPMTGIPDLCEILNVHEDGYEIRYLTYPTAEAGMGIDILPLLSDEDTYYLSTELAGVLDVSREDLRDFFTFKKPVLYEGVLTWSDEFNV